MNFRRKFIFTMAIAFAVFVKTQAFSPTPIARDFKMPLNMNAPSINRLLASDQAFTIPRMEDLNWYTESPELKGRIVYEE